MNRWCNTIQTQNSPTPQEDYRTPRLFSPKEWDNLEKYNKFINELSVRIEGGWPLADHILHDEDLLRHTLGSSPDLNQVLKGNRLTLQPDSDKKIESDKNSTSSINTKGDRQSTNQRERQQFSEDEELPFQ